MKTIYMECTSTLHSNLNTGIQRTVRNLARHAVVESTIQGYQIKFISLKDRTFREISIEELTTVPGFPGRTEKLLRWIRKTLLTGVDQTRSAFESWLPNEKFKNFVNAPRYQFGLAWLICLPFSAPRLLKNIIRQSISRNSEKENNCEHLHSGDILFMPDSNWDLANIWPAVEKFRKQEGYVVTMVHDLIPLSHPEYCVPSYVQAFTSWINESKYHTDFYICNSRTTEISLRDYLETNSPHENPTPSGFFLLGSDLDLTPDTGAPSNLTTRITSEGLPTFLVVGSLEPRKNIGFVLDAFDLIWSTNENIQLIFVGHNTWKVESTLARIRNHRLYGKRLHWLREASDSDLGHLYNSSTALIFASKAEGFGLPLVEALQRGLPVLCSDIPVFHELADGKARFFKLETIDQLVAAIVETVSDRDTTPHSAQPWPSWRDSCRSALSTIIDQHKVSRTLPL